MDPDTIKTLAWMLLLLPLITAAFNQFFLSRRGNVAALVSTFTCAVTLGCAIALQGQNWSDTFQWATISDKFSLNIGILLDNLSTRMMLVVTGIGFLVHIFSLGYMADDSAKARYFTGLSIFMFSMTGIVLSDNLAMTFIYWELVGFSSYLLIGHWFSKAAAANAAKKAFITNRVGDFGFLIGILLLWSISGALNFADIKIPDGVSTGLMTATILCLFCGVIGKSAQFPLHVWLPDAMEGPTPVSALIHAATMVAAGVYMMVRVQFHIGIDSFPVAATDIITGIGALTAVLAALMATQQNDIKRILAYSTLSQLGYMVMAVGLLSGEAAMFHLFTHAWFKALLFLGSGAIIYACHHEQDIWRMGGLAGKMKGTVLTFLIGTAALIAVPGFSGFFSKESILVAALAKNPFYFWVGAAVAFLTTFYMTRLVIVAFFGKPRTKEAEHAKEVGPSMLLPLILLAIPSLVSGFGFVSDKFVPSNSFASEPFHLGLAFYVSAGALVLGLLSAIICYARREREPFAGNPIAELFENRFYIDQFYDKILVRGVQGVICALADFLDQFLIGGMIVGGFARLTAGIGGLCRRLQNGKLTTYAFLFGLGMVLVLYLLIFYTPCC